MAKIIFVEHDGTRRTVDAANGLSVMQAAIDNLVPGIDADCGGCCSCATCHVFVDGGWLEKTGGRQPTEEMMLDMSPDKQPNSRLACQIQVSDELDGLVVTTPEFQY